jgi:predicted nuclease of restriction endonuclease-like (RecB) superfamily
VPPLAAQIGWSHHRLLMDSFGSSPDTYGWYVEKAASRGWSRRILETQIANQAHTREGAAITNFNHALEPRDAARVLAVTKDPYFFEFLNVGDEALEREVEQALIDDIQAFLIELGRGFAFYGRQQAITVDGTEYFMDLIFYHHALRRFVVIELKIGDFHPSYVGTMNFYLNAVDQQFRVGDDRESVGIILCASRNHTVAELALHGVETPIAVSTWRGGKAKQLKPGTGNTNDAELTELEDVRSRLIQRVDQHVNRLSTDPNSEDPPGPTT